MTDADRQTQRSPLIITAITDRRRSLPFRLEADWLARRLTHHLGYRPSRCRQHENRLRNASKNWLSQRITDARIL